MLRQYRDCMKLAVVRRLLTFLHDVSTMSCPSIFAARLKALNVFPVAVKISPFVVLSNVKFNEFGNLVNLECKQLYYVGSLLKEK